MLPCGELLARTRMRQHNYAHFVRSGRTPMLPLHYDRDNIAVHR